MFTTLFVFVKTPLGKKIVGYGLIAIALLIWFRWQTNKAWEQGFDKGKVKGIEELTKAKEAEWEEKQKAIDAHIQELEQAKADTLAERQEVAASRISIKSDLAKGITSLREELNRSAGEVAQIPSSELDAAIRQNLVTLR